MKSFGMTDIGRKRKVNQDYLFFSDEPIGCFPKIGRASCRERV